MDKFKLGFNGANLEGSYDGNSDGENSVSIKVNLMEVMDELKNKGTAEIEAKAIRISLDGAKVKLEVDSNKDGEAVLLLEADLAEAMDEVL